MKKTLLLMGIAGGMLILSNCNTAKKTASSTPAKSTYANEMTTVINMHCSPCHIPSKGGNKKAYDNYANTKTDIDEIIRRIELNPGDRGFMPFKHPKLNDSTILVFKKWKSDGMLER